MQNNKSLQAAVAGILALGVAATSTSALAVPDQPENWEKCTGIAKAGMNDCGALDGKHACAGQSTTENDANEWIYVPECCLDPSSWLSFFDSTNSTTPTRSIS